MNKKSDIWKQSNCNRHIWSNIQLYFSVVFFGALFLLLPISLYRSLSRLISVKFIQVALLTSFGNGLFVFTQSVCKAMKFAPNDSFNGLGRLYLYANCDSTLVKWKYVFLDLFVFMNKKNTYINIYLSFVEFVGAHTTTMSVSCVSKWKWFTNRFCAKSDFKFTFFPSSFSSFFLSFSLAFYFNCAPNYRYKKKEEII